MAGRIDDAPTNSGTVVATVALLEGQAGNATAMVSNVPVRANAGLWAASRAPFGQRRVPGTSLGIE